MGDCSSEKIVIWGLGTHGGGLACALHFLKQGKRIYILDDKPVELLKDSLSILEPYKANYELSHTNKDILQKADLVIKNPAVRQNHPYLSLCKKIETDISLFLAETTNSLIAITGTKGKSSLGTYLAKILQSVDPNCYLGGNIARSPLSFISELNAKSVVVLELSSWQLADLPANLLRPNIAVLTNLYHDHQNTYSHFDQYVKDKLRLIENQGKDDLFFCEVTAYQLHFRRLKANCQAKMVVFPSFADFLSEAMPSSCTLFAQKGEVFYKDKISQIAIKIFDLPSDDLPIVSYCKMLAGAIALKYGLDSHAIKRALSLPLSLEHRLELVASLKGVDYYNDSAATMPEATLASSLSLLTRYPTLILIVGGTDKELSFSCFKHLLNKKIKWILLEGSASDKIQVFLRKKEISFFLLKTLGACVFKAVEIACSGSAVLFSPASASFEKFKDEFDRGRKFKSLLESL